MRGSCKPLLVLAATLSAAAGAFAQGQVAAPAPDPNPFLELIPELRTAPAPAWVKPGLRITYYASAAIVIAAREYFVRDQDGAWKDAEGNGYRLEKGGEGQGGHGYTQVDVVALSPTAAVLSVRSSSFPGTPAQGPTYLHSVGSAIAVPGAGMDYWLNPDVLRRVAERDFEGLRIIRMPYTIAGKTYKALRFQYERQGARLVNVYDEETGLLLHANSATDATGMARTGQETGQLGQIRQMLTQCTYAGLRVIDTPWSRAANAAWPATFQALQYRGSLTVAVPGVVPVSLPVSAEVRIATRGPDWARYTMAVTTQSVPGLPPNTQQSARVSGLWGFGAIWLPPNGLAGLQAGQVLDQDPFTKVTASVSQAGQTPQGRGFVVVSEASPIQRIDYTYDTANGFLVVLSQDDSLLHMRTQLQLAGSQ